MQVATGAMSTLLPKLANLIMEEYNLQKRVKGEIMFLKAELESMETALLKISEAPIDHPPDIQVKHWAKEVKDLSYEIEDSIDKFMVRLGSCEPKKSHSFMGFIHRSIDLLTKAKIRHKIGTEVKDIKSRIKEVSERRDRYKVDNVVAKPVGPTTDSLRLLALYKKATELVGTEERSNELMKKLIEGGELSKKQLMMISIVGFGGLGKTTLANVVYEKHKGQFDCGAFVSVSLSPDMEKIFKDLFHQLDENKYKKIKGDTLGEAQLIRELKRFLQNKRYLIVIDDVWNKSAWEKINCTLVENEYGSRVIATTRILDVAKQVGGVYQLKPLSTVDSRKLFYQRIFGTEDKCPANHLIEVSENILKKCGGVPLAIITMASMLASKKENENTYEYWFKVFGSMGSGLEKNPDVKDMRRILYVSYYDLHLHLKTCLLYLSLYPEDYKIPRTDLILKWISEGFVHEEEGKSLYEVGLEYYNELINKSLIQPVQIDKDNEVVTCCVHDMMFDLITSLSNEENFLTTLGGRQPAASVPCMIRRLSLQSGRFNVMKLPTTSFSQVRSLIVFNQDFHRLPALSSFPLLRVLDLRHCLQVKSHDFKDICNLFHLRYLCLPRTYRTEILPKEIGNLQFLQVLDIGGTILKVNNHDSKDIDNFFDLEIGNLVKVIPSTFVQLTNLEYCLCDNRVSGLPDGFGNLKHLRQFPAIIVDSPNMLHDLAGLAKLSVLEMWFNKWDESYEESFRRCLPNLVSLCSMEISGVRGSLDFRCDSLSRGPQLLKSIKINGTVYGVPRWMSSLPSLSFLEIPLRTVGEDDLQALGSIPSLNNLYIGVEKPTQGRDERLVIGSSYQFRCLTRLAIKSDVMEVSFAQGTMQNLQTLQLIFRPCMTMHQFGDFDFGLGNLSSLEHVSVETYWSNAEQVEAAEDAIRKALSMNPSNPTLKSKKPPHTTMIDANIV